MTALPNPFLSAAAEISSAEPLSAGPAVVAGLSPGSVTTAGTNSAWVHDCDRTELQEIQSSDGGQRPTDAAPTLGNMLHRPSSLVASGQGIDPTNPSEAFTAVERLNHAEAATDCINEIFTFARGLMRNYQPGFQEMLNEIAPFPMEYLPDYRLGDDDQPLFLRESA